MLLIKSAKIISIALGPFVWFPLLIALSIFKTGLSKNQQQILFPLLLLFLIILPLSFFYFMIKSKRVNDLFFNLFLTFFMLALISTAITHFWKISLHAAINTAGTILINFLFDWNLPFLYLLIPVVFWSRYVLKHHTATQLFFGSVVSGAFVLLAFYCFGYI